MAADDMEAVNPLTAAKHRAFPTEPYVVVCTKDLADRPGRTREEIGEIMASIVPGRMPTKAQAKRLAKLEAKLARGWYSLGRYASWQQAVADRITCREATLRAGKRLSFTGAVAAWNPARHFSGERVVAASKDSVDIHKAWAREWPWIRSYQVTPWRMDPFTNQQELAGVGPWRICALVDEAHGVVVVYSAFLSQHGKDKLYVPERAAIDEALLRAARVREHQRAEALQAGLARQSREAAAVERQRRRKQAGEAWAAWRERRDRRAARQRGT